MMDGKRCKYFYSGLNRCELPSSEDSDLCSWHSSFFWNSESLVELERIKFQSLGLILRGWI